MVQPEVGNIVGPSRMTHNGRIFGAEPKTSVEGPSPKKDEEAIVPEEAHMKEVVNNNNAADFLKII